MLCDRFVIAEGRVSVMKAYASIICHDQMILQYDVLQDLTQLIDNLLRAHVALLFVLVNRTNLRFSTIPSGRDTQSRPTASPWHLQVNIAKTL